MEKKIRFTKKYIAWALVILFGVAILWGVLSYKWDHTFTREKWKDEPEQRALFVTDMISKYELIGMTEKQVMDLLGENDNDMGTFVAENRFVYWLGLEGQFFKIDSEWLLVDFEDGIVSNYAIETD